MTLTHLLLSVAPKRNMIETYFLCVIQTYIYMYLGIYIMFTLSDHYILYGSIFLNYVSVAIAQYWETCIIENVQFRLCEHTMYQQIPINVYLNHTQNVCFYHVAFWIYKPFHNAWSNQNLGIVWADISSRHKYDVDRLWRSHFISILHYIRI